MDAKEWRNFSLNFSLMINSSQKLRFRWNRDFNCHQIWYYAISLIIEWGLCPNLRVRRCRPCSPCYLCPHPEASHSSHSTPSDATSDSHSCGWEWLCSPSVPSIPCVTQNNIKSSTPFMINTIGGWDGSQVSDGSDASAEPFLSHCWAVPPDRDHWYWAPTRVGPTPPVVSADRI